MSIICKISRLGVLALKLTKKYAPRTRFFLRKKALAVDDGLNRDVDI